MNSERQDVNVVILGSVGAGKKTLVNHFAGREIFRNQNTFATGSASSYVGKYETTDRLYNILTVDTGSQQKPYKNPFGCIREEFRNQRISLIIFVISKGSYTDESHGAIIRVIRNMNREAESISALVITHCEGMKEEERRAVTDNIGSDPHTSQIVDFMAKGVHTVGFPKIRPDAQDIMQQEIDKDEEVIRKLMEDFTEPPLRVEDLQIRFCTCTMI